MLVRVSASVPARICRSASALGGAAGLVLVLGPGAAEAQGPLQELASEVPRGEGATVAALSDCLQAGWEEAGEVGEVRKPTGWPGRPAPP